MEIVPQAGPSQPSPVANLNGLPNGPPTNDDPRPSSWPLFYDIALTEASIAPSHLSGSQDLLARLDLAGAYDRAVRPYLNPKVLAANPPDSSISAQDPKGKGRAVESPGPATAPATIQVNGTTIQEPPSKPAAAAPPEKAKSMKKHYSHLIGDVPGQNKLAKDHHIRDLLLNPDGPDHVKIIPFDSNALRDGFTLEIGVLPDFDTSIWRADAAEERKRRKKRKQEDVQMASATAAAPSPGPNMSVSGGTPNAYLKKRKLEAQ